jgi:hypothetical protein
MAQSAQKPRRPPMSAAQKDLLRKAQLRYIAEDPRWAAHKEKLADAQRRPDQRERLSQAMISYMASDPRWPDHRTRMQAAALEVTKLTLLAEEIETVIELRRKGRNFEYIAEELCVSDRLIRRELKELGIPTGRIKADRRAKPSAQGPWRCFDPP